MSEQIVSGGRPIQHVVVDNAISATVDTTGLATSVKQSDGSQKTQVVDGSGNVIGATANALDVNIKSGSSSGTQYDDGAARGAATGTLAMGDDGTNIQSVKVDTDGHPQVDVLSIAAGDNNIGNVDIASAIPAGDNNIGNVDIASAIPAGTNNIGDVDVASIAAGDNNIGNVDIASAVPAGDNNIGNVDIVTLPAGNLGQQAMAASLSTVPANNITDATYIGDIKFGEALPAGTNAIGKVLPPDIDITTHTNYARKYYTSTGAATDGIIWSPAAGKRWHVTHLYIQVSAAATVTLEDDKAGGDDPVWKGELAANSGVVMTYDPQYPLASGEDAADLIITTTAGNVYVTAVGYEI